MQLRESPPQPLCSFDVGVAADGSLLYRSARGSVGSDHPSMRPAAGLKAGSALMTDGSVAPPVQPPTGSSFDLCPEASGAICYVDRNLGSAQWDPPDGSTCLEPRPLLASDFDLAPPGFPAGLGMFWVFLSVFDPFDDLSPSVSSCVVPFIQGHGLFASGLPMPYTTLTNVSNYIHATPPFLHEVIVE